MNLSEKIREALKEEEIKEHLGKGLDDLLKNQEQLNPEVARVLFGVDTDEVGYIDIPLGFQLTINSVDELPPEAKLDTRDYPNIECSVPEANILRVTGPKSSLVKIIEDTDWDTEDIPTIQDIK